MTSIGTGYDLSAAQFSPDGRVFQIEYALKAVENSGTAVALRGKDGVVFAVEKLVTSKLYEKGANKRLFTVDRHVGVAVAGLLADAKQVVENAAREAANYRSEYGTPIPLSYLKDRVSLYVHAHTLYSAIRPYGAAALFGAYDMQEKQARLYCVEPSGTCYGYYGCAIGKAKQTAKTEMEKIKLADMTCRQLAKEAARIIFIVHDEVKDKDFELELSWVCEETNGLHQFIPPQILVEAERYAKQAMEEESDQGED
ncbi:proteasome subunit alpha type-3-like [Tropilaelaps mercedesae]|uniref:Proteasome subunit alpha type-3-like n=1 Tax=Tropilaelaps mercedesae TaxID=418985 RepID=A0A1V9Y2N9_9ACAR|nr:proteasome subunit alpha type-3-like [Tropilaelaps mercedesae]